MFFRKFLVFVKEILKIFIAEFYEAIIIFKLFLGRLYSSNWWSNWNWSRRRINFQVNILKQNMYPFIFYIWFFVNLESPLFLSLIIFDVLFLYSLFIGNYMVIRHVILSQNLFLRWGILEWVLYLWLIMERTCLEANSS